MRTIITLAVLLAALVWGALPAFATSDPATAVKNDVLKLANDVKAARAVLTPDLLAINGYVRARNQGALKTASGKLRSDAKSVLSKVQKDRKQLISDVKAARAAGIQLDVTLLKGSGSGSSGALGQVRSLQHQLRTALAASRAATPKKTHTTKVHTTKVHTPHQHVAKHHFVKHHVTKHVHTGKHPHPKKHAHTT